MGGKRKKNGGRVTPKGGAPLGRLSAGERAGLNEIFVKILRSARTDLTDDLEPLGVRGVGIPNVGYMATGGAGWHGRDRCVRRGADRPCH